MQNLSILSIFNLEIFYARITVLFSVPRPNSEHLKILKYCFNDFVSFLWLVCPKQTKNIKKSGYFTQQISTPWHHLNERVEEKNFQYL